jgi:serine/threonine-protein kinase
MEFLEGQTLSRVRQRARREGNVPLPIHLRVLAEVLAGLHYVHELTDQGGRPLGIVHRDVTPSNVFLTYDGRVKVVDFGIAKATTCTIETQMGVLKGKLSYMSPESVRGEPVDRRSDIFSVGVMLWEAATGLRFWQDHDDVAVYRRLVTGDLPLHRAGMQAADGELLRIAKRALAIEPCQRYENAEQMQQEIESLLDGLGNIAQAPSLSVLMDSWFAAERERLRKLVDRAEARFPAPPVSQRRPPVSGLSDSYAALDPSEPPTALSTPSGSTFRGASYDVPLDPGEWTDFRPRRHGFLLGAAAVALSVGVAVVAQEPAGRQKTWLWSTLHEWPSTDTVVQQPVLIAPAAPTPSNAAVFDAAANEPKPPITPLERDTRRELEVVPQLAPPVASARAERPLEPSSPGPKARRGKRTPDRENPWGI